MFLREHGRQLMRAAQWGDVALVCVAFLGAYALTQGLPAPAGFGAVQVLLANASLLVVAGLGFRAAARREHLYRSRRLERLTGEFIPIVRATAFSFVLFAMAAYVLKPTLLTGDFIVLFTVATVSLIFAQRLCIRAALRQARRRGRNFRRVLIVGTNNRARRLCRTFQDHPEYGIRVLGFADDRAARSASWGPGLDVVTDLDSLASYVQDHVVDEVFIALPVRSYFDAIQQVIAVCEAIGITSHVITDFYRVAIANRELGQIGVLPYMTYTTEPRAPSKLAAKRVIDIALSAAALVVLSPLMAVCALAVKLSSPGRTFFGQRRVGYHHRQFTMWKFRTMFADAEARKADLAALNEADGPVFKIRADPRVTPVGRILRRFSLDELPQLWNVLRGDMSLVGPRPLPAAESEACNGVQRRRLSMKPGLTCTWQVSGRNAVPFERWVEMDLAYIDNWSLALDAQLMLRTIPAVLTGRGAF